MKTSAVKVQVRGMFSTAHLSMAVQTVRTVCPAKNHFILYNYNTVWMWLQMCIARGGKLHSSAIELRGAMCDVSVGASCAQSDVYAQYVFGDDQSAKSALTITQIYIYIYVECYITKVLAAPRKIGRSRASWAIWEIAQANRAQSLGWLCAYITVYRRYIYKYSGRQNAVPSLVHTSVDNQRERKHKHILVNTTHSISRIAAISVYI